MQETSEMLLSATDHAQSQIRNSDLVRTKTIMSWRLCKISEYEMVLIAIIGISEGSSAPQWQFVSATTTHTILYYVITYPFRR